MSIYAIGVLFTLVLYVIVGNYAGSKVKDTADYYVMGRKAPTILIVGTLVASYISTNSMMGETGFAYDGYSGLLMILVIINIAGYVIGALYFGRYVRRSEVVTIPEYFGKRFNSRKVQIAAGCTVILGLLAYLLAVTQGSSMLMVELLGIDKTWATILVFVIFASFTIYGGSPGVIITDTLMFFVFMAALLCTAPILINQAGGWSETLSFLANIDGAKAGILSWHGAVGPDGFWPTALVGFIWAITLGVAWLFVVAVSPWQLSRYLMAKNEHVVIRSALIASMAIVFIYLAFPIIGITIAKINPGLDNSERAYLWAAYNILPKWLGIGVLSGILAAGLSSASTFLSVMGFSITNDILPQKMVSIEKNRLKFTRITVLVCGIICMVLVLIQPPSIFWLTYFAGTVFASSWGIIGFLSVWNKKVSSEGAFWGIILGFLGNVVPKLMEVAKIITLPVYLDVFITGILCSAVGIYLGTKLKPEITQPEIDFQNRLFIVPEDNNNPIEVKKTLNCAKLTFAVSILTTIVLLIWYGIPYSRIIGN